MKRLPPFWQRKSLDKMTRREWESLCSGCGRCCVLKLEDPRTLKVDYTNIACRFLDMATCRCTCYRDRKKKMPACLDLFHCKPEVYTWLPSSCAYRLLAEGYSLPAWHPLVSGDAKSTRKAGMSVCGHVISEDDAWWAPAVPPT
jgi:uncharacterized protein